MTSEDAGVSLLSGALVQTFKLFGKMVDRMAVNWDALFGQDYFISITNEESFKILS